MKSKAARKLEDAFRDHTGISPSDYFVIGTAAQARFIGAIVDYHGLALAPKKYFSSVGVQKGDWEAFFRLTAANQDRLAESLRAEDEKYGRTTYRSLTFERFPLFEGRPGVYLPISMRSLVRRITTGVFHILTEAALDSGRDRRLWTSHFGIPFQRSVENTIRRGVAASTPAVKVRGEIKYTNEANGLVDSTDVMVVFPEEPLFAEVVSGPMQVATMTRGDLETFNSDLERLVVCKAKQIDRSVKAFRGGYLKIPELDPGTVKRVWPVIISAEPFPQREKTTKRVKTALAEAGYFRDEGFAPLALVSAEELFFCEGFMEGGESLLELIRAWKTSPGAKRDSPGGVPTPTQVPSRHAKARTPRGPRCS